MWFFPVLGAFSSLALAYSAEYFDTITYLWILHLSTVECGMRPSLVDHLGPSQVQQICYYRVRIC